MNVTGPFKFLRAAATATWQYNNIMVVVYVRVSYVRRARIHMEHLCVY